MDHPQTSKVRYNVILCALDDKINSLSGCFFTLEKKYLEFFKYVFLYRLRLELHCIAPSTNNLRINRTVILGMSVSTDTFVTFQMKLLKILWINAFRLWGQLQAC